MLYAQHIISFFFLSFSFCIHSRIRLFESNELSVVDEWIFPNYFFKIIQICIKTKKKQTWELNNGSCDNVIVCRLTNFVPCPLRVCHFLSDGLLSNWPKIVADSTFPKKEKKTMSVCVYLVDRIGVINVRLCVLGNCAKCVFSFAKSIYGYACWHTNQNNI